MCARLLAFSNGDLQALFDRSDGFYRRQLVLTAKEKPADRVDCLLYTSSYCYFINYLYHTQKQEVTMIVNTEIYFFIGYLLFLCMVQIINKIAIAVAANPMAKRICEISKLRLLRFSGRRVVRSRAAAAKVLVPRRQLPLPPVSYTHLDVYKRQQQKARVGCQRAQDLKAALRTVGQRACLGAGEVLHMEDGEKDVYKRQYLFIVNE